MPTLSDYSFVFAFIVLLQVAEYKLFWPRFRAAIATGKPDARVPGLRIGVVVQWVMTITALTIWIIEQRPLGVLGLNVPTEWRIAASVVLVAIIAALSYLQLRSVGRLDAGQRARVVAKMGAVSVILPHSKREYSWFLLLSVTAGFCEELLCRGYLVWFFTTWLGVYGAYVIVIILFGLGHAYQGRNGVLKTAIAGAVLTAIYAITQSLLPGMIIHALVDVSSGTLGYRLLCDEHPAPPGRGPLQT